MPTLQMRKKELRPRNLPRVTLSDKPGLETRTLDSRTCTLNQYAYITSSEIKDLLLIIGVFKYPIRVLIIGGFFFSFFILTSRNSRSGRD